SAKVEVHRWLYINTCRGKNSITGQLADGFQVLDVSQDGNPPGTLKSVSIDEDGIVSTTFTNGQTQIFGQIALAKFGAPDQLTKLGNNIYQVSVDSGQAVVSAANTSGLGRILSETLESSNVDLAQEFVNMITAQRAFQANSRTVTTVDDMLQEVLSLKR
ncbi:MAG: flagellar hook-basal body complex protein, partial [Candidatus Magnetoovum sp. WYHC-5]|nr:flagellar hook-basal body complex protein [Candidatus Magnetoovum sp. WYHC-5]